MIVSKSTCELMRLRATVYADTFAEDRKKSPCERERGETKFYGCGVEIEEGTKKKETFVCFRIYIPLNTRHNNVKSMYKSDVVSHQMITIHLMETSIERAANVVRMYYGFERLL